MEFAAPWGLFHWGETNGVFTFLSLLYAIPRKSQAVRGKFTKTLSLCSRALLFPKSKNFQRPAWACPARQRCFAPGLRLPASASALGAGLASCWPRPQQLLPVSATGGGRRRCPQRGSPWQAGPLPTGRLRPDRAQKGGPCYRGRRLLDKRTLSSCRESWQRSTTVPETSCFARPA